MPNLNELYLQVIEAQKKHLEALQKSFNMNCDEISSWMQKKLQLIDTKDLQARQKILLEAKRLFDGALDTLKKAVEQSQHNVRNQLEQIQAQRERETLIDLENQLSAFASPIG